jgi:hypothetical protein
VIREQHEAPYAIAPGKPQQNDNRELRDDKRPARAEDLDQDKHNRQSAEAASRSVVIVCYSTQLCRANHATEEMQ